MAQTEHLCNDNISRYKFFFLDTYIPGTVFFSRDQIQNHISFLASRALLIKYCNM